MRARPLHVGVITLPNIGWPALSSQWKRIEDLGFDSIWDCDHFANPSNPAGQWFEGWTLLAALATRTSRVRLGSLVTTISYRNPAMLAKEALTIDHVSGGRLEIGIGAGGSPIDCAMTGVDIWEPAERVQRFRELVHIVDALLRNDVTSFEGRHYRVHEASMHPSPIQSPRPPLTLAAEGPRALGVVADYADRWVTYGPATRNGAPGEPKMSEQVRRNNERLDELCNERGRDPLTISRCLLVGWTAETPFASLSAFEDFVGRYREAGFSEFIIYWAPDELRDDRFYRDRPHGVAGTEMLERLAAELLPKLRRQ